VAESVRHKSFEINSDIVLPKGVKYLNKKIIFRPLLILSLSFFYCHIYAQSFTPGVSVFDSNGYVEYIPGNLPVIISAPHGGYLKPDSIPDRDCDNCAYGRDSYTQELARSISEAFFEQMGGYAHIVINLLYRKKFDANRDIGDAADGNPIIEESWANYHQFIESAKNKVIQNYERGLFIDLHGHGHDIQRLELGYLLSRSELELSDSKLNTHTYIEQSSIQTLVDDNINLLTHSELLRGRYSLGSLLSNIGIPAVPSASDRYPYSFEPYFSGGYNTARHGSRSGGKIDGIQIECNQDVRFNNAYKKFAVDLTKSINKFIDIQYDDDYLENYTITGLSEDFTDENLKVFPNPAINKINVKSNLSKLDILIYDYLGMQISAQTWQGYPVDISFLKKGCYILKFRRDDGLPMGSHILIKN
jgi:N-formylglutamate amidohydrolase